MLLYIACWAQNCPSKKARKLPKSVNQSVSFQKDNERRGIKPKPISEETEDFKGASKPNTKTATGKTRLHLELRQRRADNRKELAKGFSG